MPPERIQQRAPEGFVEHSELILSRIKSIAHDTAKGDQELNLLLGEMLLVGRLPSAHRKPSC